MPVWRQPITAKPLLWLGPATVAAPPRLGSRTIPGWGLGPGIDPGWYEPGARK